MPIPSINALTMISGREQFGNVARTNQFQVFIENGWGTSGSTTPFLEHLKNTTLYYGIDWTATFKKKLSLLCFDANLPASTYATAEVKDNFMGVAQEFAHTRINIDIDFSFYVDSNYYVLTFFEAWMDYVSGGNSKKDPSTGDPVPDEPSLYDNNINPYYRRFNYPKFYKNQSGVYIKKFENNWDVEGTTNITYQLINAFPKSIASIPVTYGEAEVMKVTVTMNYDRYRLYREIAGPPVVGGAVKNSDGTWTVQLIISGDVITKTVSNTVYQTKYALPPVP
jgi:hypothetical protein